MQIQVSLLVVSFQASNFQKIYFHIWTERFSSMVFNNVMTIYGQFLDSVTPPTHIDMQIPASLLLATLQASKVRCG